MQAKSEISALRVRERYKHRERGREGDTERQRENERHLPPTTQVYDDLGLVAGALEKASHGKVNDMQAEIVASIDERSTALKLSHKVAKEVRFVWVVYAFYTALRHDGATVCLHHQLVLCSLLCRTSHHSSRSARFARFDRRQHVH
jgi:hypothetical protein